MVNWVSPLFSTEEGDIIKDAIHFTKNALRNYYAKKYSGASEITQKIIDDERGEIDETLNKLWDFIVNEKHGTMITNSERVYFFSRLGSALNLYLLHIDDEIKLFNLPQLKKKRGSIAYMIDSPIYNELETHSYDEYYIKKQEIIPNLLFFSYSSKDKDIVGKISDILESKYGFKIFRAHDMIRINQNWRNTIRENLQKCEGLVAYVTENFVPSPWVHQECGWVMGRSNIPIYSIFLTHTRPGFLEERQGKDITEPTDPIHIAALINDYFKNPT